MSRVEKQPITTLESKIHINTIKTMGDVVKLFDNAFKLFMDDPSGENYRDMETKRENMFLTCDICIQTTFPETDNLTMKDAIRLAKDIMKYKETPEELRKV
jgi:hypothetical protein